LREKTKEIIAQKNTEKESSGKRAGEKRGAMQKRDKCVNRTSKVVDCEGEVPRSPERNVSSLYARCGPGGKFGGGSQRKSTDAIELEK